MRQARLRCCLHVWTYTRSNALFEPQAAPTRPRAPTVASGSATRAALRQQQQHSATCKLTTRVLRHHCALHGATPLLTRVRYVNRAHGDSRRQRDEIRRCGACAARAPREPTAALNAARCDMRCTAHIAAHPAACLALGPALAYICAHARAHAARLAPDGAMQPQGGLRAIQDRAGVHARARAHTRTASSKQQAARQRTGAAAAVLLVVAVLHGGPCAAPRPPCSRALPLVRVRARVTLPAPPTQCVCVRVCVSAVGCSAHPICHSCRRVLAGQIAARLRFCAFVGCVQCGDVSWA